MNDSMESIVGSHQFSCRASDGNERPVLPPQDAEPVVLLVYASGSTRPLCRYYDGSRTVPRCDFEREGMRAGEDELGICPYAVKRQAAR